MVSVINSISASSIPLLFGSRGTVETINPVSTAQKLLSDATGNTDDVFKAGNAIGQIIEIVAGMNASDAKSSIGMFTMDGATRTDGFNGEWTMTKTGTGKVVSDAELQQNGIDMAKQQAAGSGPEANVAKAYLKAISDGTMKTIDLSNQGVTANMTQKNYYNADGSDKGQSGSYDVKGLREYLNANTFIADDGTLRDKETGKYATISQNGTQFSYNVS